MKITNQLKLTIAGVAIFTVGLTAFENFRTREGIFDASVVNKSGIVRGATQRLIKLENQWPAEPRANSKN